MKKLLVICCVLLLGLSVNVNDSKTKKTSDQVRTKRLEDEMELRRKQIKTKKVIAEEVIATIYGLFHDRGDPASADYSLVDFTVDTNYYDLDLSAIVPSGAKTVLLRVEVKDDSIVDGGGVVFRKNGNTNSAVVAYMTPQVVNITQRGDLLVACDSNQVIEYAVMSGLTALGVTIKGWWK